MQPSLSSSYCIAKPIGFGFYALAFCLLLGLLGRPALASSAEEAKFEPHSRSHFLLREVSRPINWFEARTMAEQMEHNGVKGRLAMVHEAPIHLFLEESFALDAPAWIGLRYWCPLQKAKWTNGDDHERRRLNAWAEPWYDEEIGHCAGRSGRAVKGYMPVYYLTQEDGFRWRAATLKVSLNHFFVEFPADEQ